MPSPLRAGLTGIVDYAGLFPPASLPLPEVVERFARYAESDERWMLGRLIVPFGELDAFTALIDARALPAAAWHVSVLLGSDASLPAVHGALAAIDARLSARVTVRSVEFAAASVEDVARFGESVPPSLERYVEVPLGGSTPAWLDAVARTGCLAKVRTGGVTEDRFPSSADLAAFLRDTSARGLAFKATAGLHHPLRNRYRLTYAADSPSGRMHGFVNLLLAAAVVQREPGGAVGELQALLEESDPRAFSPGPDALAWRGLTMSAADLAEARTRGLRSVGSCSFEEPVEDLRQLGWLRSEGR